MERQPPHPWMRRQTRAGTQSPGPAAASFPFLCLVQTAIQERVIFIIDEGQFVDPASWAFLEKLIKRLPIFIIMSLSPFLDMPCPSASTIIKNRNTTYIILGAVQPGDIRDKVCLDLNVKGIPKDLDL